MDLNEIIINQNLAVFVCVRNRESAVSKKRRRRQVTEVIPESLGSFKMHIIAFITDTSSSPKETIRLLLSRTRVYSCLPSHSVPSQRSRSIDR